jgi:hypothetical protein
MNGNKLIQFGIDKVYIAVLTKDDATGATYDSTIGLVRLEGVTDLKIKSQSKAYNLDGDNGTVDVRSITSGFDVECDYGILTLDQLHMLKAGTIVEKTDGTGNVISRKYVTKGSDQAQYFGLIGVVESSNTKIILTKVKATDVEIPNSNLSYAIVKLTASAVKRDFDGVMHMIQEDATLTPASLADFDSTYGA